MKCNDCGDDINGAYPLASKRPDLCGSCWDNRMLLVEKAPSLQPELFGAIQRAMGSGRGTARLLIEEFVK